MKNYEFVNSLQFAKEMDARDPLRIYREDFYFPVMHDKPVIYLTGNSLGLQPKSVQDHILTELEDWATFGVEGHFHARNPWFSYQDILTGQAAMLLGAKPAEVVCMNSLTVNLHLLLVSFYKPDKKRYKIICEHDAFPSDIYALKSQAAFHGFDPDEAVIMLKPREGEYLLRTDDILQAIENNADSLATVMLGAVNYYTGQFFEIEKITDAAHSAGATAGFNLAHAAGNVMLKLHDWNVDYACFCSYKYLNAGPGSVAGIFVHERYASDKSLPKFNGWWGNDPATRFKMEKEFEAASGARSWQLSNAPVFTMAPLKASLNIFEDAGFDELVKKSHTLTAFLWFAIDELNKNSIAEGKKPPVQIITPQDKNFRGCQLSLIIRDNGKEIFRKISDEGVMVDWREPDVMRAAPVPLYNSFEDIFTFGKLLSEAVGIEMEKHEQH